MNEPRKSRKANARRRSRNKTNPPVVRSRAVTLRYNVIERAMIAGGIDHHEASRVSELLRKVHNAYWHASADFSHIVETCIHGHTCGHPPGRFQNARALINRLEKIDKGFNALDYAALTTLEDVINRRDEIRDLAMQDSDIIKLEKANLMGLKSTLPRLIDDIQNLLDERVSQFPLGFLRRVATGMTTLNEDMAEVFGDDLFEEMKRGAHERFGSTHRGIREGNNQPNYIELMRLGMIPMPDLYWIDDRIKYYARLSKGGAKLEDIEFIHQVSNQAFDPDYLHDFMALNKGAWPALRKVYGEDIARAKLFAEEYGERVTLLEHLVSRLDFETADAERIVKYVHSAGMDANSITATLQTKRDVRDAVHAAYQLVPKLFLRPLDLAQLLEGKQNTTKIRKFAEYEGSPARQAALLEFCSQYPHDKIRAFTRAIESCDTALVFEAITACEDIKDAIGYLREYRPTKDPYAAIRETAEFRIISKYLDRGLLTETESVHTACNQLRQVHVPAYRTALTKHPLLMIRFLQDANEGGQKNEELLRLQRRPQSQDAYGTIHSLYSPSHQQAIRERMPIAPECGDLERIIFVGDRIRSKDVLEIGQRLNLRTVHVDQSIDLGTMRRKISARDIVAYYVDKCGHKHSGPVKYMTQDVGALWVEIRHTNGDRIYDTIIERMGTFFSHKQ